MEGQENKNVNPAWERGLNNITWGIRGIIGVLVIGLGAVMLITSMPDRPDKDDELLAAAATPAEDPDKIVEGIHVASGLIVADGFELVKRNCLGCHSGKLISQNRMTRDRWLETIRWMQETQKLWDLGTNEAGILDYLETNYAPKDEGRRPQLANVEWYILEE